MSDSKGIEKPSESYERTRLCVELMRDNLTGEPAVKSKEKRERYLPHDCLSTADKGSANLYSTNYEQIKRYERYVSRAEFDDVINPTASAIIGAIYRVDPQITLPSRISMMEDDVDGDGLTLIELGKVAAREMLSMNYVGFLAEYVGLADADIESLTVADTQNAQPAIKLYTRENIIKWDYRREGGKLQLTHVVLRQMEEVRKPDSYECETKTAFLSLELDENGYYVQRKYIQEDNEWSEDVYPLANGKRLTYIPFEICAACEHVKGNIPENMGYLYAIATKQIGRLQVSADLKESLFYCGAPISTSTGWDAQSVEVYREMTGNDSIVTTPGSHIPLPDGGTFDFAQWSGDGSAMFKYLDKNAAEIRALGGMFDTTDGIENQTAKAAAIKAAEKSGVLSSLVGNLEQCLIKMLGYCAEFAGGADGNIDLVLNREFSVAEPDPVMRDKIRADYMQGLISQSEALRQLEKLGFLTQPAEELLLESSTNIDSDED